MNDLTSAYVADIDCPQDILCEFRAKRLKAEWLKAEWLKARLDQSERLKASLVESERLRTQRLAAEPVEEVRPMEVWQKAELQRPKNLKTKRPVGILGTLVAMLPGPDRNSLRE